jgi:hypothetical protein
MKSAVVKMMFLALIPLIIVGIIFGFRSDTVMQNRNSKNILELIIAVMLAGIPLDFIFTA